MCLARNSAGEEAYVADEVITARSKARVRVNNTDAEGRMVMADVLCKVSKVGFKCSFKKNKCILLHSVFLIYISNYEQKSEKWSF